MGLGLNGASDRQSYSSNRGELGYGEKHDELVTIRPMDHRYPPHSNPWLLFFFHCRTSTHPAGIRDISMGKNLGMEDRGAIKKVVLMGCWGSAFKCTPSLTGDWCGCSTDRFPWHAPQTCEKKTYCRGLWISFFRSLKEFITSSQIILRSDIIIKNLRDQKPGISGRTNSFWNISWIFSRIGPRI